MLRVGMIGIGGMGRGHVSIYEKLMSEGKPVQLVAICDIDPQKLEGKSKGELNIDIGTKMDDTIERKKYTDYKEMIAKEDLDYVDIATPTYLHAEIAIYAMKAGKHVLSEKPMAINVEQCQAMVDTAKETGKKLMTAQCLRFWPEYRFLKDCFDDKRYGDVTCGYFYRGGGSPKGSWNNWMADENLSGGALLDQHVHDIDTIQWIFGTPPAVSTVGRKAVFSTGYDAVSTNYLYPGIAINAQDDWTINGKGYGFKMMYRVSFDKAMIAFDSSGVTVYPVDGEKFSPELDTNNGYYNEICYFMDCIINDKEILEASPESTMESIKIGMAERASALKNGAVVEVK